MCKAFLPHMRAQKVVFYYIHPLPVIWVDVRGITSASKVHWIGDEARMEIKKALELTFKLAPGDFATNIASGSLSFTNIGGDSLHKQLTETPWNDEQHVDCCQ